jgi:hypothetical protein
MTSPVPSTGSGKVSTLSGDPNAFKTAAFMIVLRSFDRRDRGRAIETQEDLVLS